MEVHILVIVQDRKTKKEREPRVGRGAGTAPAYDIGGLQEDIGEGSGDWVTRDHGPSNQPT